MNFCNILAIMVLCAVVGYAFSEDEPGYGIPVVCAIVLLLVGGVL